MIEVQPGFVVGTSFGIAFEGTVAFGRAILRIGDGDTDLLRCSSGSSSSRRLDAAFGGNRRGEGEEGREPPPSDSSLSSRQSTRSDLGDVCLADLRGDFFSALSRLAESESEVCEDLARQFFPPKPKLLPEIVPLLLDVRAVAAEVEPD